MKLKAIAYGYTGDTPQIEKSISQLLNKIKNCSATQNQYLDILNMDYGEVKEIVSDIKSGKYNTPSGCTILPKELIVKLNDFWRRYSFLTK